MKGSDDGLSLSGFVAALVVLSVLVVGVDFTYDRLGNPLHLPAQLTPLFVTATGVVLALGLYAVVNVSKDEYGGRRKR